MPAPLRVRHDPARPRRWWSVRARSGRVGLPARFFIRGRARPARQRGRHHRRRARRPDDRLVRGQPAVLPRRRHRQAGGLRHDQRPGHGGRHDGVPRRRLRAGRGAAARRAGKGGAFDARDGGSVRRRARHRRYQGRRSGQGRRHLHHHLRHRPDSARRRPAPGTGRHRATWCWCPATWAGTAWRC